MGIPPEALRRLTGAMSIPNVDAGKRTEVGEQEIPRELATLRRFWQQIHAGIERAAIIGKKDDDLIFNPASLDKSIFAREQILTFFFPDVEKTIDKLKPQATPKQKLYYIFHQGSADGIIAEEVERQNGWNRKTVYMSPANNECEHLDIHLERESSADEERLRINYHDETELRKKLLQIQYFNYKKQPEGWLKAKEMINLEIVLTEKDYIIYGEFEGKFLKLRFEDDNLGNIISGRQFSP